MQTNNNLRNDVHAQRHVSTRLSQFFAYYTIGRLPLVLNSLLSGYFRAQLDPNIVAAGPLCDAIAYLAFGTLRAGAANSGVYINRERERFLAEVYSQEESSDLTQAGIVDSSEIDSLVGSYLVACWLMWSCFLLLPVLALTVNMHYLLSWSGVHEGVARETQLFLYGFLIGVPAIMAFNCDVSFLGSCAKKKSLVLNLSAGFGLGALAFNVLFYWLHYESFGLGLASSASSWLMALITRQMLWCDKELCQQYRLFEIDNNFWSFFGKHVRQIVLKGFLVGLQNISEWGNLLLIAWYFGTKGRDELVGMQVALSALWVSYSYFLYGLMHATAWLVSDAKKAQAMDLAKKVALTALKWAIASAMIPATLVLVIPKSLAELFTYNDVSHHEIKISKHYLQVNALGYVLDACRLVVTACLVGFSDVNFSLLFNTLIITGLSFPAGLMLVEVLNESLESIFITREAGILLALAVIAQRLFHKSSSYQNANEARLFHCAWSFFTGEADHADGLLVEDLLGPDKERLLEA